MRNAHLLTLIGIGFLSFANTSSAGPLASSSFASGTPVVAERLVQEVQAWSCRVKLRDMTIEQRRRCHGYGGPRYGYEYPDDDSAYGSPGYGLGVTPFFGFTFHDDDHHHHWRRHHRRYDENE
jgi:hypothetical protein